MFSRQIRINPRFTGRLKKLSKHNLKFKDKSWITPGIRKSRCIKNQYISKFINLKDPHIISQTRSKCKNIISYQRNLGKINNPTLLIFFKKVLKT